MCNVNRCNHGSYPPLGFCGETDQLRVGYVGPHFGEEPPITGKKGSGSVFFTGCSLRCSFCQNHQISQGGIGNPLRLEELLERVEEMIARYGVHNINFVTPDHFFPHVFSLVTLLRNKGLHLPLVYNLSGYQSLDILKVAGEYSDIYLPDFKYSDATLASRLSKCRDYTEKAIEAIAEMVRQKGFLDSCICGSELAQKGVLVRHLILPGNLTNSIKALTILYVEFGSNLPLSLMSQYHPVISQTDKGLNRALSREEFDRVYAHAMDLGFENLFVQFPEGNANRVSLRSPFLPDFTRSQPFRKRG